MPISKFACHFQDRRHVQSSRNRVPVIATSMGFTLAASTFTRTSVGFVITGTLTLESLRSSSPLYECICQACILSSGFSFKLTDSFDRERKCAVRTTHLNPRIAFSRSISLANIMLHQMILEVRNVNVNTRFSWIKGIYVYV